MFYEEQRKAMHSACGEHGNQDLDILTGRLCSFTFKIIVYQNEVVQCSIWGYWALKCCDFTWL